MPKTSISKLPILFLLPILIWCFCIASTPVAYCQEEKIFETDRKHEDSDYFLAVTVSAGGSRSAVWSAAVLRELYNQVKLDDDRSILDEIDYISGVSAGSLSSAYYCINKPENLDSDRKETSDFFKEFVEDMCVNIEAILYLNPKQWVPIFITPAEKSDSIKKYFNRRYFEDCSYTKIEERNRNGDAPALIINGTVLDTGGKFLFTALDSSNFFVDTKELLEKFKSAGIKKSNLPLEENIYSTMYTEDLGIPIGEMKIANAVVSSISLPFIKRPEIFEDLKKSIKNDKKTYYHISDGAVYDSLGLESVLQLLNNHTNVKKKRYRGAMIIVIDARHRVDQEPSTQLKDINIKELFFRTKVIYSDQAMCLAYITYILAMKNEDFSKIKFVHISPYDADDDIVKDNEIKMIPTRFSIDQEDVITLNNAAVNVVENVKDEIVKHFEGE